MQPTKQSLAKKRNFFEPKEILFYFEIFFISRLNRNDNKNFIFKDSNKLEIKTK